MFALVDSRTYIDLKLPYHNHCQTYHINEEAPVVRRYERALESLGYGSARIITTFGGSDANVLNSHGISSIVVSNAMNSVHTTDEYFYMNELIKSAQIAVKLMTL